MPEINVPVRKQPAGPATLLVSKDWRWRSRQWLWVVAALGGLLAALFYQSFIPKLILFANDTTLGQMNAAAVRLPSAFRGIWHTGMWVGVEGPAAAPTFSAILALVMSPETYFKFYEPFTLFFLGLCAWVFFRQLQLNPAVCLLGGIAAALNSHFFSIACWGLGAWNIAAGTVFLALAAICTKSVPQLWARAILAGLAVGMNLMEAFDVGAILSVYVGFFILWQLFAEEGPVLRKAAGVFCTEVLVIFFAAFIAAHSISSLVDTEVKDVAELGQDIQTKEQRWDPATRWSLPKVETLNVVVPGLFGYRLLQHITVPDKSSSYWGTVGADPRIEIVKGEDSDKRSKTIGSLAVPEAIKAQLKSSDAQIRTEGFKAMMHSTGVTARFSGSGEYAGMVISLLAIFGLVNSWRGANAPYSRGERRAIWFWGGAALISLLAAWGRHAFFYRLLYQLPYISTIRNPIKFMHPFHIAWVILAVYGLEALWRRYIKSGTRQAPALSLHLSRWWANVAGFEKKWTFALLTILALSLVAFVIFDNWKPHLIYYLTQSGFDDIHAERIARFSIAHAGWFLALLLVSSAMLVAVISGAWSGPRGHRAWILLGAIIVLDLVGADLPWIRYYNYQDEYASNSVVDFLRDKPYEHRVTGRIAPKGLGSGIASTFGQLYNFWQQNNFPYYNIQTLDFAQWSRVPKWDADFLRRFALQGDSLTATDFWPVERLWELTNTRYILTFSGLAEIINKQADDFHKCHVNTYLSVGAKPGTAVEDAGDLTAIPDSYDTYALIESSNVLPRARLYANWQTMTNNAATLDVLISHEFNPHHTVLLAQETPVSQPPGDPAADAGTVTVDDYQPKYVRLHADAKTPGVLLLNDRVAPDWKVWVDQKPAPLLRCNYIMRGVFLTPGAHTVEFRFHASLTPLYVSLSALAIGILTAGYVVHSRVPVPTPSPSPSTKPSPSEEPASQPRPATPRPKQKRRQ